MGNFNYNVYILSNVESWGITRRQFLLPAYLTIERLRIPYVNLRMYLSHATNITPLYTVADHELFVRIYILASTKMDQNDWFDVLVLKVALHDAIVADCITCLLL